MHSGTGHHPGNSLLDRCQIRLDPRFKVSPCDRCVQVESMVMKVKRGVLLLGECDFGALDRLMQLIAEVCLD